MRDCIPKSFDVGSISKVAFSILAIALYRII